MRLNDPQIELVHDDPFMGYINEDTTVEETSAQPDRNEVPASPLAIVDEVSGGGETDPPTTSQPDPLDVDHSEEELDVGENSRTEAISSIEKSQPITAIDPTQQSADRSPTVTQTRQPFVIVLLME